MKKEKIIKLDIDDMPLVNFATYMVDRLSGIPCNAKVRVIDGNLCIVYFKNECKK